MWHDYRDIIERIATPPLWWDEHAVPRFVPFSPRLLADIYADEAALVLVTCQSCAKEYPVAFAWSAHSKMEMVTRLMAAGRSSEAAAREAFGMNLAHQIRNKQIHFGDPPNACDDDCSAGATMNSEPRQVLEYWSRDMNKGFEWARDRALEIDITPDWVREA